MARATSEAECIQRHEHYKFDMAERLDAMQTARLEWLIARTRIGWQCLDIGCNSGYMQVLDPKATWHGVDVHPGLVKIAQRRMESAQVAPAERLPFTDKRFELSCVAEILEHVFDPVAVLEEAVRVTRNRLIGSTPHEAGPWGFRGEHRVDTHDYHVRCYTRTSLKKLLSPYGQVEIDELMHKGRLQVYLFKVDLS